MEIKEYQHILAAIIILTIVGGFSFALAGNFQILPKILVFALIVILVAVFSKKIMASLVDCDVEHSLWKITRYGWRTHQTLLEIPAGIIFPIVFSAFSLGLVKFPLLLIYEAKVLKRRAAKRFGFESFTELTEWHNALIGSAGIISILIIAIITYFLPANFEYLAKLAVYYAFANMIPLPFSNTDGMQILFGSKILFTILSIITTIFFAYALLI